MPPIAHLGLLSVPLFGRGVALRENWDHNPFPPEARKPAPEFPSSQTTWNFTKKHPFTVYYTHGLGLFVFGLGNVRHWNPCLSLSLPIAVRRRVETDLGISLHRGGRVEGSPPMPQF